MEKETLLRTVKVQDFVDADKSVGVADRALYDFETFALTAKDQSLSVIDFEIMPQYDIVEYMKELEAQKSQRNEDDPIEYVESGANIALMSGKTIRMPIPLGKDLLFVEGETVTEVMVNRLSADVGIKAFLFLRFGCWGLGTYLGCLPSFSKQAPTDWKEARLHKY